MNPGSGFLSVQEGLTEEMYLAERARVSCQQMSLNMSVKQSETPAI